MRMHNGEDARMFAEGMNSCVFLGIRLNVIAGMKETEEEEGEEFWLRWTQKQ